MLTKKLKSLVCFLIALITALSCVGCAVDEDIKEVDSSKTQLYVGIYDGGLDDDWLESAIGRFEALYANKSFEEGKTGVQVFIDKDKSTMDGIPLLNLISSKRAEVYFTERVYYYDYISKDALADITDVVTAPLTEFGETDSIESKLAKAYQDYFKVEGKYYGLPFHTANNGIVFDADMFEQRKFYFKEGGGWTGSLTEATAGQDGEKGTFDDGLPITYDDFFALCERIQSYDITPILWTGKYLQYPLYLLESLWADYEGYEQMLLNYNFDGNASSLVKTSSNGIVPVGADPVKIDINNGYELQKQAGKYHALSFAKRLISNPNYYDSTSFSPSLSHTGAQEQFLLSRHSSAIKDVAMLIEGTWWEMEATSIFQDMVTTYGDKVSKASRKFGSMPMPKVSAEDVSKGNTIVAGSCVAFVSNYCAENKLPLAKKFLQFMHTDVSLSEFNSIVSIPRPFDYEIAQADWDKMTYFGKSVYEMHKNANIIYNSSSNDVVRRNGSYFSNDNSFMSRVKGVDYDNPIVAFHDNNDLSVADYFNGLYTYKKNSWSTIFN